MLPREVKFVTEVKRFELSNGLDSELYKNIPLHLQETALRLVESTDWERLSVLLAPDELAPMRPLVLLLGYGHCSSLDNVQSLIQTLCPPQVW